MTQQTSTVIAFPARPDAKVIELARFNGQAQSMATSSAQAGIDCIVQSARHAFEQRGRDAARAAVRHFEAALFASMTVDGCRNEDRELWNLLAARENRRA